MQINYTLQLMQPIRNLQTPTTAEMKNRELLSTVDSENKPRGLYFPKALSGGPIFGGAYIRSSLSIEGNLRFKSIGLAL